MRIPLAAMLTAGLLACLATTPGHALEPVLARVLSLDTGAGTLVLQVEGEASPREISLGKNGAELPAGVTPGALVRLWQGKGDATESLPAGTRIVPLGGNRFEHDRTGVRARLSHNGGRGPGRGGHGGGR